MKLPLVWPAILLASSLVAAPTAPPTLDLPDAAVLEVMRYLYRWHLDESTFWTNGTPEKVEVWLRPIAHEHDSDDASRYAEMLIPTVHLLVKLKQADYPIAELDVRVHNAGYRIIQVERYDKSPVSRSHYEVRVYDFAKVAAHLWASRHDLAYPDESVRQRLGSALKEHINAERKAAGIAAPERTEPQAFYVAPLSPVSNDLWVFWENDRKLIKFSSDADYTSDAFWVVQPLGISVYDLQEDVVVSLAEAPRSDRLITRGYAGRALFNCVVLGQKVVLSPEEIRKL